MIEADVKFATIEGIQIAQTVLGEGVPVVMLHGWGANIRLMLPLAQRLAPMGYQIYILDFPGFGQSQNPPIAWGVSDYANFILRFLDHHTLEKVHLFGHSFGGRVSLVLGAEHPERILKIALADSAGVRPKSSTQGQFRLKIYRFALNILNRIGLSAQANQLRNWYSERYGSADYKAAQGILRETFVKVVNEDLLPYAARVQASTLLLWGDQDQDTPLWQGQLLEKTIPDAGLVTFEGAGHYSYLDRLNETVRIVDHFFKH
jgi:pimeloyl-ACP methyl ester carboxylesterase